MSTQQVSWTDSFSQAQGAIQSLTTILPAVPQPVTASENPAFALLNDPELAQQISNHICQPDSGAGNNQLCRWLYDTFHTSRIDLQLVVLRFLPVIAGVHLSRVPLRKPLAGFEAVLLAIYAHETASRKGQAVTINISDASHPSVYHENKHSHKTASPELHLVVVSPALEPQGTIRSTKRARIIGWLLSYIIMLQPMLRILSHCLMGISKNNKKHKELHEAACHACRSLYARALHDINPKAILAIGSLLKLIKYQQTGVDHTELPVTNVIHL
ncbi:Hyccin [Artemisia annua]|uniref:Hyccin n=1 Tax=Artemisia annua TaxID=35608 RepID=A0A2U1P380_ARTAN|nr:Hyccin [Artemisia annua]